MPISVEFPVPQNTVGPGLSINLRSDFIGPFPSDARWDLQFTLQPDFIDPVVLFSRPCTGPITTILILSDHNWTTRRQGWTAVEGSPIFIHAQINTPTETIDSGTRQTTWDTTTGLGWQAEAIWEQQGSTQSGFTQDDRLLLTDTERRTQTLGEPTDLVIQQPSGPVEVTLAQLLSRPSLDSLLLLEVTRGPTSLPVVFTGAIWYYGVVVRVTTIPSTMTPKTPDAQWYFPDLAVLRVFRGSDLVYRRGIHTPTFRTEDAWESGWLFNAIGTVLGVAPDITIRVNWRAGVAGQVFLLRYP